MIVFGSSLIGFFPALILVLSSAILMRYSVNVAPNRASVPKYSCGRESFLERQTITSEEREL